MTRQQFYQYLHHPNQLDIQSLATLQELVKEFPYFQPARMLLIKNLHNLEHIRFNGELKAGAAHIAVRSRLFDLLHQKVQEIKNPKVPEKESSVELLRLENPTAVVEHSVPAVDDYFEVSDELPIISAKELVANPKEPAVLPSADFLEFDTAQVSMPYNLERELPPIDWEKDDSYSFSDWLVNIRHKPSVTVERPERAHRLIDDFLSQDTIRIVPRTIETVKKIEETVKQSVSENEDLLTETLASIYIKQKHYDKAIHIFEKLRLKYPEKSIYFANRISELEKLSNNL